MERSSGEFQDVIMEKNEAYDKIKMVPKGCGVVAYGVLCRWFTDASSLGLAKQARC